MGINFCVTSLKYSVRRLKALDKAAAKAGDDGLRRAVREIAVFATSVVVPMMVKLDTIYKGKPLPFHLIDDWTPKLSAQPQKTINMFKKRMLGAIGLRHHICKATDRQYFDTYRAIGWQSFTAFELLVHRAVMGIELEIDDLEEGWMADSDENTSDSGLDEDTAENAGTDEYAEGDADSEPSSE